VLTELDSSLPGGDLRLAEYLLRREIVLDGLELRRRHLLLALVDVIAVLVVLVSPLVLPQLWRDLEAHVVAGQLGDQVEDPAELVVLHDLAPRVQQLLAGLVVDGVDVIVLHRVGAHELEVSDELLPTGNRGESGEEIERGGTHLEVVVLVVLDLLSHGADVHGLRDDGGVAGGDAVGDGPREELLGVLLLEQSQQLVQHALQRGPLLALAQHAGPRLSVLTGATQ
jgi:hypothetical protein